MTYYFRDYKDRTLFFALDCFESPYKSWYNEDYSFYAVRRKPYVAYFYLGYDNKEVHGSPSSNKILKPFLLDFLENSDIIIIENQEKRYQKRFLKTFDFF